MTERSIRRSIDVGRLALVTVVAVGCIGIGARVFAQEVQPSSSSSEPAVQQPAEPAAQAPEQGTQAGEAVEPAVADPAEASDGSISSTEIQSLQETMKGLGYFYGPADGRMGPRTIEAIQNFQRDQALPVTGDLDAATLARIHEQAQMAHVNQAEPGVSSPSPEAAPVSDAATSKTGADPVHSVGGVFVTTGQAIGTAGSKTVDATVVAGKAVGTAGAKTGEAVATAGKYTADSVVVAGKAVGFGTKVAYEATRHAMVGDRRTDDDIVRSIQSQYSDDDRIVPGEIDIKSVKGNVTLTLPDGAKSDAADATRLAKLTAGVKTVTAVYVSLDTYVPPEGAVAPATSPVVPPTDVPPTDAVTPIVEQAPDGGSAAPATQP